MVFILKAIVGLLDFVLEELLELIILISLATLAEGLGLSLGFLVLLTLLD